MPIKNSHLSLIAKLALVVWGVVSLLQGAGLSFFIFGPNQNTQAFFIDLVYMSVLAAGLLSFLSSRIASLLLCASAIAALAILFWTNSFGHGAGSANSLVFAVIIRPALASWLLFILSRWEKKPLGCV
jgi:hypothetical protein